MAGYWPDVPGRRMAIDGDGTQWWVENDGDITDLTSSLPGLNDEDDAEVYNGRAAFASIAYHYFIFPQKRDVDGLFTAHSPNAPSTLHSSVDTTTGFDGTWDLEITSPLWFTKSQDKSAQWRSSTYLNTAIGATGVKAVKVGQEGGGVGYSNFILAVHLYGKITAGETPERLLFLDDEDPSDTEFATDLDWGDTPRGTNRMKTLLIKNNSSTLTANTIQITAEDLSWDMADYYDYSKDGKVWSAVEVTVSSLAAGATQRVYVRQKLGSVVTLHAAAARLYTNVASWT